MADPLSVAASIATLATVAVTVAQYSSDVVSSQQRILVKRFGLPLGLFISLFLRDTANRYERIEEEILNGSDEVALAFKQSVIDECNMTAVAGAIIAQVAITGLSLPSLSLTHWIARAFFLVGVTSGCLSVYYACVLQRVVGKLYRAERIREWLRAPPPSAEEGGIDSVKASLPAVFILSAPFTTVKVSIFACLTGLAVYQAFTWKRGLDTNAGLNDSRNVFITFVTGTGFCFLFFLVTFSAKDIESLLRFGRTMLGTHNHQQDRFDTNQRQSEFTGNGKSVVQGRPQLPPSSRRSADRVVFGDLAAALDIAAQAHIQCAESDRRVAVEYARLSNTFNTTYEEA